MLIQRANVYRLEPTESQAGHFKSVPARLSPGF